MPIPVNFELKKTIQYPYLPKQYASIHNTQLWKKLWKLWNYETMKIKYSMAYTPNTFTTSTLSFLIQFKIKERQQRIYFRKFREGKLWRHVKSKKLRDKFLQKNIQKCKIVTFLPFKYDTINKYHIFRTILHFNLWYINFNNWKNIYFWSH